MASLDAHQNRPYIVHDRAFRQYSQHASALPTHFSRPVQGHNGFHIQGPAVNDLIPIFDSQITSEIHEHVRKEKEDTTNFFSAYSTEVLSSSKWPKVQAESNPSNKSTTNYSKDPSRGISFSQKKLFAQIPSLSTSPTTTSTTSSCIRDFDRNTSKGAQVRSTFGHLIDGTQGFLPLSASISVRTSSRNKSHTRSPAFHTTLYSSTEKHPSAALLLRQASLWDKFHAVHNEMIITKAGRCLFPTLSFKAAGLIPEGLYSIQLNFQELHPHRHRFSNGEWKSVGEDKRYDRPRISQVKAAASRTVPSSGHASSTCLDTAYMHPNKYQTGDKWMAGEISFSKVKLTNQEPKKTIARGQNGTVRVPMSHVFHLRSFHKYRPQVHLVQHHHDDHSILSTTTFTFERTSFMAVTHYQNEKVNELKKDNNPHAKGFREVVSRSKRGRRPSRLNLEEQRYPKRTLLATKRSRCNVESSDGSDSEGSRYGGSTERGEDSGQELGSDFEDVEHEKDGSKSGENTNETDSDDRLCKLASNAGGEKATGCGNESLDLDGTSQHGAVGDDVRADRHIMNQRKKNPCLVTIALHKNAAHLEGTDMNNKDHAIPVVSIPTLQMDNKTPSGSFSPATTPLSDPESNRTLLSANMALTSSRTLCNTNGQGSIFSRPQKETFSTGVLTPPQQSSDSVVPSAKATKLTWYQRFFAPVNITLTSPDHSQVLGTPTSEIDQPLALNFENTRDSPRLTDRDMDTVGQHIPLDLLGSENAGATTPIRMAFSDSVESKLPVKDHRHSQVPKNTQDRSNFELVLLENRHLREFIRERYGIEAEAEANAVVMLNVHR